MKFAYTIVYVPDVSASLAFFEKAFGFTRRFLHESGTYGELDTGETTLAFAAHSLVYNFVRIHKTMKTTPALEAGITDKLWSIEDIASLF